MFLALVRQSLIWALNKLTREKSTALTVVQPAYVHYGTWSRLRVGYEYKCGCGQEITLSASERDQTLDRLCDVCKKPFNLLRSIDALALDGAFKVDANELARRLDSLAIRQVAQPAPQRRYVEVGEENSGEVEWAGSRPSSGVQWREV